MDMKGGRRVNRDAGEKTTHGEHGTLQRQSGKDCMEGGCVGPNTRLIC